MRTSRFFAVFISTVCLFFQSGNNILAHSGRTNSEGCHNCNTGSCAGTYHCHGGGTNSLNIQPSTRTTTADIVPSPLPSVIPSIPPSPSPSLVPTPSPRILPLPEELNVNPVLKDQANCLYDIYLKFKQDTDIKGLAIQASRFPEKDPGENVDTRNDQYVISDLDSGTWYINVKSWDGEHFSSEIAYWEVKLEACLLPTTQNSVQGNDDSSDISLEALAGFGIVGGLGWLGWKAVKSSATTTPTNLEKSDQNKAS